MQTSSTKVNSLLNGAKDSLPIVLGYIPIGLTLGIMAKNIGFTTWLMGLMSTIVYAGSSQFIAIDMINNQMSMAAIIVTTFFVNFRHFLMSSAYSPHFREEQLPFLAILSFGITDESFSIGMNTAQNTPEKFNRWYMIGLHTTSQLTWILSTMLGVLVGDFVPNYEKFGLNFALPAMFIGLIALLIKNNTGLLICFVAGTLSVILLQLGLSNWNVIVASLIACIAIVGIKYVHK